MQNLEDVLNSCPSFGGDISIGGEQKDSSPVLQSSSGNSGNLQGKLFNSWYNRSDDMPIYALKKNNKELIMHSIQESDEQESDEKAYMLS